MRWLTAFFAVLLWGAAAHAAQRCPEAGTPPSIFNASGTIPPTTCGMVVYQGSGAGTLTLPGSPWAGTIVDIGPGIATLQGIGGSQVNGSATYAMVVGAGGTITGDPYLGWYFAGGISAGGGGSGISGLTTGQVGVAGSATTLTSSVPFGATGNSTLVQTSAGGTISNTLISGLPNANLANSSVTLNTHSLALGGSLTLAFTDFAGAITSAQCPNGTAIATGCLEVGGGLSVASGIVQLGAVSAVTHQWINSINSSGVAQLSQPAFADLTGTATAAQMLGLTQNHVYQGNVSNQPADVALSTAIDAAIGSVQGDVLYRNASTWVVLAPGTSGQFLETLGAAANPAWATPSGSGTQSPIFVGACAGTAPTYTLASPTPTGFALTLGYTVICTIPASQTNAAAATLNVAATGALPIVMNTQTGLSATAGGELIAGLQYQFTYSTSAAAACGSSCYIEATLATSAVQAGTTQTISAAQWASISVFNVTTASQTLTLPLSTGLNSNGALFINTIGSGTATIQANASDAINGGSAGGTFVIPANAHVLITRGSAANTIDIAPGITLAGGVTCTSCNVTFDTFGRATVAANGSGGGAPGNIVGYTSGDWYGMWPYGYSFSTATPTLGNIFCAPLTVYQTVHVDSLGARVSTGGTSSNIQLALYGDNGHGFPGTLIGNTASIATTTSATVITGTFTSTSTPAANYWLCENTDTTSAVFTAVNTASGFAGGAASIIGNSSAANAYANSQQGIIFTAQAYGTWPSLAAASWSYAQGMPQMFWHVASIP